MKIKRAVLHSLFCGLLAATLTTFSNIAPAEEIKLKLLSTGAEAIMGGFAPQHLDLSASRPAGIKAVPAGVAAPLYGVLNLGPRETPGSFYIIVDEPAGRPARVFVDANGNGNFTDDQPVEWIPESAGSAEDGRQYTNYSGAVTFKVAYGSDVADLGVALFRFDKSDPRRAESKNWLYYYADYVRTGAVSIGPKTYAAILGDTRTTGDFRPDNSTNKPSAVLYLDLNGDGKFARRAEAFPAGTPFNIGGTTYEITNLTASGDAFQIVNSARTAEETKPLPNLTAGNPALPFEATTTEGRVIKFPGAYKGKVVLLDFWATWCGPCVAEFPNVVAAYEKFHNRGFDVLGVSFDRTNAAARLASFTRDHHAPWPQIYEGRFWQTSIGQQYAIDSIPHAFLVDGTTGRILAEGEDVRGEKLEPAIARALGLETNGASPRKIASADVITVCQFDDGLFPGPSQSKVAVNLTMPVGLRQEWYGNADMAGLRWRFSFLAL